MRIDDVLGSVFSLNCIDKLYIIDNLPNDWSRKSIFPELSDRDGTGDNRQKGGLSPVGEGQLARAEDRHQGLCPGRETSLKNVHCQYKRKWRGSRPRRTTSRGGRAEGNGRGGIGAAHTQFETAKRRSEEWYYYISNRNMTAAETMHWLLDVYFGEDGGRGQMKTAQQNLNMVRKLSLNIMRGFKRDSSLKEALTPLMNPNQILTVFSKN